MPKVKKTNYVSYSINKLEGYIKKLEDHLDRHPINTKPEVEDRIDVQYNQRTGSPVAKVVATIESQVTNYYNILEKLPKLLEALNNLKKLVEASGDELTEDVRGGKELPGLFKSKMITNKAESKEDVEEDYDVVLPAEKGDEDDWEDQEYEED